MMRLFRKKKLNNNQKKGVFDPTKTEIYSREYDTFLETLNGEIGLGSKDNREITLDFGDDHIVKIYAMGNNIVTVFDSKFNFNMGDRVYWSVDFSDEEKSALSEISSFNDISKYIEAKTKVADVEELNRIFYSAAIENFLELNNNFTSDVKVTTNLIQDKEFIKQLEETNFFKMDVERLSHNLSKIFNLTTVLNMELGFEKDKYNEVNFNILGDPEEFRLTNSAERMIVGAAENGANLQDVQQISGGFIWSRDVLTAIKNLINKKLITVDKPSFINIALPELEIVKEPPVMLSSVEFAEAGKNLVRSLYLETASEEKLYQLFEENQPYEEKSSELEREIKVLQEKYQINRNMYDAKKMERNLLEYDESEKEVFSLDEISDNVQLQNSTDKHFFELEKLEKEVSEYHIISEGILNRILEIAEESESQELDKFRELVSNRIKEIKVVESGNLAFENVNPEDVEEEERILSELKDSGVEGLFEIQEDDSSDLLEVETVNKPEEIDVSSLIENRDSLIADELVLPEVIVKDNKEYEFQGMENFELVQGAEEQEYKAFGEAIDYGQFEEIEAVEEAVLEPIQESLPEMKYEEKVEKLPEISEELPSEELPSEELPIIEEYSVSELEPEEREDFSYVRPVIFDSLVKHFNV